MNIEGFRLVGAGLLAWISKAIIFALSCAQEASGPARAKSLTIRPIFDSIYESSRDESLPPPEPSPTPAQGRQ